jgi:hypothetical protein
LIARAVDGFSQAVVVIGHRFEIELLVRGQSDGHEAKHIRIGVRTDRHEQAQRRAARPSRQHHGCVRR